MSDMFLHEDLSKPENRVSLGIFGMMAVPPFRERFQRRLGLPATSALYPPRNRAEEGYRPDLAVKDMTTDRVIAWAEGECGWDGEHLARFRKRGLVAHDGGRSGRGQGPDHT